MALVERVTALTPADFAELIEHAKRRETIIRQIIWLRLNIHLFCADITQRKIWKLKQKRCKIPTDHMIPAVFRRLDANSCGYCTCVRKPSN